MQMRSAVTGAREYTRTERFGGNCAFSHRQHRLFISVAHHKGLPAQSVIYRNFYGFSKPIHLTTEMFKLRYQPRAADKRWHRRFYLI